MSSGTLRYTGFPEFIKALVDMGFLKDDEQSFLKESISWKDALKQLIGAASSDEKDLIAAIDGKTKFGSPEQRETILRGIRWLGLFSNDKVCTVISYFAVRGCPLTNPSFRSPRAVTPLTHSAALSSRR
jgi:saccharopine dehydrogenase-like NADP-dependent oxidoreductase